MSFEKLARIDLNLLVCLHVLLECNNVTKAAERLHLSQSAVSKNLARLRQLFDDPLFTRAGYGMAPTAKARRLQPLLAELLFGIDNLTRADHFDPSRSRASFRIAAVESLYALLFPKFIGTLFSQAPGITLEGSNWGADTFERLQQGQLDFAITGTDRDPGDGVPTLAKPDDIDALELFQDPLCCVVSSNHPLLRANWDRHGYLSQRHIAIKSYQQERWLLDSTLAAQGTPRDVALYVPDLYSAAELCSHTHMIATLPQRYAHYMASLHPLTILPLPLSLSPLSYTLFWHKHRGNDPAHRWLRALIQRQCQHA
ncbi:LysR substrate-binding domain-containing protein [uncultured Ferrimonas sp.]|uniref:LysR substrate-binding domain-containing protein n=1 Tax=uncultured Ferrimonas sp. TaxID=432640 RepID=UPI002608B590|nr:LysR substrate-binding domain-containing protein [uncultured Ferrimonas sp.]